MVQNLDSCIGNRKIKINHCRFCNLKQFGLRLVKSKIIQQ